MIRMGELNWFILSNHALLFLKKNVCLAPAFSFEDAKRLSFALREGIEVDVSEY